MMHQIYHTWQDFYQMVEERRFSQPCKQFAFLIFSSISQLKTGPGFSEVFQKYVFFYHLYPLTLYNIVYTVHCVLFSQLLPQKQ